MREILEETGIKKFEFIDFEESYSYDFEKDNGEKVHKKVTFFLGEVPKCFEISLSEEHDQFLWATKSEVESKLFFDSQKEIFERAFKSIS